MESNVALVNVEDVPIHCSVLVFPLKLFRFLHEEEEYQLSHIASFQPDGRSFRIHNRIEFVTATVRWFSFSKYASFRRQLNIYGFKRVLRGTDKGCYYHKNFIRGQYLLAQGIKRIPVKNMMIDSSINHMSVAHIRGMTTGVRESPMITSNDSQAMNVAIQPNILQNTTPHISSDQYVDINNIINHYLRNALTNSISTLRASIGSSSIPLFQTQHNIRGTNAPLIYDTDVSTLSELQRLQNASNQSITDSLIPFSLPATTLELLPLQQSSILSQSLPELLNVLTNLARLPSHELTNCARSQTPSEIDLLSLQLNFEAHNARGQNQIHLSQSDAPFGAMPIHPTSSVNVAAVRDILLQENELNRRALDEQTIRNAIILLQRQLPPK